MGCASGDQNPANIPSISGTDAISKTKITKALNMKNYLKKLAHKAVNCPTCAPAKVVRAVKTIKKGFKK